MKLNKILIVTRRSIELNL